MCHRELNITHLDTRSVISRNVSPVGKTEIVDVIRARLLHIECDARGLPTRLRLVTRLKVHKRRSP